MEQKIVKMSLDISTEISTKIGQQIKESEEHILTEIGTIDTKLCAVSDRVSKLENTIPEIHVLRKQVDNLKKFVEGYEKLEVLKSQLTFFLDCNFILHIKIYVIR